MVIRELASKSAYSTIGYIDSEEAIRKVEQYIWHNLPVLREFKYIITATNYNSGEWIAPYEQLWKTYFPECICLTLPENRGHNHGYADLDNHIVNYCKENNIDWLCKSANDIIIESKMMDKEINEADFYYLNGIGYGGMVMYDFDYKRIIEEDFYPQTNFYFINVSKIDYLNDQYYLNQTYNEIKSLPEYNGRIWEYIGGWSCEKFLKDCIERNNLKKEHLIPEEKYISLLDSVKMYEIHDSSHKNLMIEGVCHFHFSHERVLYI
jgi:hypothetical protein